MRVQTSALTAHTYTHHNPPRTCVHRWVAVFNLANQASKYQIAWVSAGAWPAPAVDDVEDVWAQQPFAHADAEGFNADLEPHGVLLLKLGKQ
jgi:hypothetical protein